jgi:REP element-mobilizing transposase RayT
MQFGGFRIYDQQGAYFLTFTVVDWIDAFTRPAYKQMLIDALRFYQESRGLLIFGYVIMTNHVHLLVQTPEHQLSDFIRDFKRWTSRQMREMLQEPQESRKGWILNRMGWRGNINAKNQMFQFWQPAIQKEFGAYLLPGKSCITFI